MKAMSATADSFVHGRKVVSATTGAMPRDALVRTLELDLLTAPAGS